MSSTKARPALAYTLSRVPTTTQSQITGAVYKPADEHADVACNVPKQPCIPNAACWVTQSADRQALKRLGAMCRAPLRLRTGMLLYGPPGCGKTHAVAAAVAASKLRCLSIKGPEVLNKYIGASEAAVRDLFR